MGNSLLSSPPTPSQISPLTLIRISKNKLLWGGTRYHFKFSGQVIPVFTYSKNKRQLPIVLFFKKVLFSFRSTINIIAPNFALKLNDLFLNIFEISLSSFGWNTCYIHFDVLQCIFNGVCYYALLPIQNRYWFCKLPCIRAQIEPSSTFVFDYKISTGGRFTRNLHLTQFNSIQFFIHTIQDIYISVHSRKIK